MSTGKVMDRLIAYPIWACMPCSLVLLVPPALPYMHAHTRVYVCVRINNM